MKRKWKTLLLVGLITLSIGIALNKYSSFTSTPEDEIETEPPQETEPSQEAIFGKIAFVSDVPIYTMEVNGSNQSKLYTWTMYGIDADGRTYSYTNSPNLIAPSPDGKKIAFVGPGCGPEERWREDIYLVNIDGSGLIKLTDDPERDIDPAWSPDGKKIAFASYREGHYAEIYIMNADGSNQTRITKTSGVASPDWSPDGKKIVFIEYGLATSISIMNADGSNPTAVIGAMGTNPKWSPDGTKIVYQSSLHYKSSNSYAWEIFVADLSFKPYAKIVQLTSEDPLHPYSVNDTKIGFGKFTFGLQGHRNPSWSPDGKKIFFDLALNDEIEICIMNADGSNQTKLTENLGRRFNRNPVWLSTP